MKLTSKRIKKAISDNTYLDFYNKLGKDQQLKFLKATIELDEYTITAIAYKSDEDASDEIAGIDLSNKDIVEIATKHYIHRAKHLNGFKVVKLIKIG